MELPPNAISFVSHAELNRSIARRECLTELDTCEMTLVRLPDDAQFKNEMLLSTTLRDLLDAPHCDYVGLRILIENIKDTIEAARLAKMYGTRAEQLARAQAAHEKITTAKLVAERRASIRLASDIEIDRDVLAANVDELLALVSERLVDDAAKSRITVMLEGLRLPLAHPQVDLARAAQIFDECQAAYNRLSIGSLHDKQVRAALHEQESQRRRRAKIRLVTSPPRS